LLPRLRDPLATVGTAIVQVYAYYTDADRDHGRLASPLLTDIDELSADVADAREAARRSAIEQSRVITMVGPADTAT